MASECDSFRAGCESSAQDDVGLREQWQNFVRHPAHNHSFAATLWTRPAGRATVTDPADKNVHEKPSFVRKALSWGAGTGKYARKSEKRAGYFLGVRAQGNVFCLLEATRPPNKNTRKEMSPLRNGWKRRISQKGVASGCLLSRSRSLGVV